MPQYPPRQDLQARSFAFAWRLMTDTRLVSADRTAPLIRESGEFVAILTTSVRRLRATGR